jgi:hypothetical protein
LGSARLGRDYSEDQGGNVRTAAIELLAADWLRWKEAEAQACDKRREVEDLLSGLLEVVDTVDQSKTYKPADGVKITVTTRLNHKVDGDALQALAAELGLTAHLGQLFRWKPDINAKAWKAADESITGALAPAITTTAGRPSFKIVMGE